jgi:hypothetical protein
MAQLRRVAIVAAAVAMTLLALVGRGRSGTKGDGASGDYTPHGHSWGQTHRARGGGETAHATPFLGVPPRPRPVEALAWVNATACIPACADAADAWLESHPPLATVLQPRDPHCAPFVGAGEVAAANALYLQRQLGAAQAAAVKRGDAGAPSADSGWWWTIPSAGGGMDAGVGGRGSTPSSPLVVPALTLYKMYHLDMSQPQVRWRSRRA